MEKKEPTYNLLKELYYEYMQTIDSAYCQCEMNSELVERVEKRLGLVKD